MKRALMLLPRETPNDFYDVTCALALIIPVMPAEERHSVSRRGGPDAEASRRCGLD